MKVFKVNALPDPLEPSAIYFVKEGDKFVQYLADATGIVAYSAKPVSPDLLRYDLPAKTSVGEMDLSTGQIFKIDASATGANTTLSFTNAPVGKTMTIVIEITGNVKSVTLPVGMATANLVDNTLGAVSTVMIVYYNGSKFHLTGTAKFD